MATHSSILACRIPGMAELAGCRLWGHTESDTTEATYAHLLDNFQLSCTIPACHLLDNCHLCCVIPACSST